MVSLEITQISPIQNISQYQAAQALAAFIFISSGIIESSVGNAAETFLAWLSGDDYLRKSGISRIKSV